MSGAKLRTQDWEHRLHVLGAWRKWRHMSGAGGEDGMTYRAVLDGCAVTVRALCYALGVRCHFGKAAISNGPTRLAELMAQCSDKTGLMKALSPDEQRAVLEVLYLGNRAVAHPDDGIGLDHHAGPNEMTVTINLLFTWLAAQKGVWPDLAAVPANCFQAI
jgi:hypothetical protein